MGSARTVVGAAWSSLFLPLSLLPTPTTDVDAKGAPSLMSSSTTFVFPGTQHATDPGRFSKQSPQPTFIHFSKCVGIILPFLFYIP